MFRGSRFVSITKFRAYLVLTCIVVHTSSYVILKGLSFCMGSLLGSICHWFYVLVVFNRNVFPFKNSLHHFILLPLLLLFRLKSMQNTVLLSYTVKVYVFSWGYKKCLSSSFHSTNIKCFLQLLSFIKVFPNTFTPVSKQLRQYLSLISVFSYVFWANLSINIILRLFSNLQRLYILRNCPI